MAGVSSSSSSSSKSPKISLLAKAAAVDARLDRILQARMTEFASKYLPAMEAMNLTALEPRIYFRASKEATLDLCVQREEENIIITVSAALLARPEDLDHTTPIGACLHRSLQLYKKEKRRDFWALKELSLKPALWEAGKRFLLTHELAHIYHHHICYDPATHAESRREEMQADLTALEFSEDAEIEGGIHFFQISGKHRRMEGKNHPASQTRIAYLQAHKDALGSGKAVRSPVLPVRPLSSGRPSATLSPAPAPITSPAPVAVTTLSSSSSSSSAHPLITST